MEVHKIESMGEEEERRDQEEPHQIEMTRWIRKKMAPVLFGRITQ
jgi:hypothetical protein